MTQVERMIETFRNLPIDKRLEVMDFADFLAQENAERAPLTSSLGLLKGRGIDITDEDIRQIREDMRASYQCADI